MELIRHVDPNYLQDNGMPIRTGMAAGLLYRMPEATTHRLIDIWSIP